MADPTDEPHQNYLQELKAAAEAQMRRSAPELDDDAGPRSRRQKVADGQDDASDHVEGHVGRYTYAAIDTLARGCTAFLGSCGFRRERSSTKEVLNVLNKVLPQGTKLQLVKVGCNGLVVITAEAAEGQQAISPTATVQDILQQIESGVLQRTKFCQRIMPAELTCALTASALKDALTAVVKGYISQHGNSSSNSEQQQPVEFAVAYKNRDNVTVPGKQDSQQEQQPGDAGQQQQQQGLQGQQQQQQQQDLQGQQQQQRQQQQAVLGALQPVPQSELVDRGKAIEVAAAVMLECCKDVGGAKVNLMTPQMALLLEVIPLARHQLACAVAAVPASMVVTKPKLAMKPTGAGGK